VLYSFLGPPEFGFCEFVRMQRFEQGVEVLRDFLGLVAEVHGTISEDFGPVFFEPETPESGAERHFGVFGFSLVEFPCGGVKECVGSVCEFPVEGFADIGGAVASGCEGEVTDDDFAFSPCRIEGGGVIELMLRAQPVIR